MKAGESAGGNRGVTVFCATEPCAMGGGALLWAGVGRIVFALGRDHPHHHRQGEAAAAGPSLAALFGEGWGGGAAAQVAGGFLEEEASAAAQGAASGSAAVRTPATRNNKRAKHGAPSSLPCPEAGTASDGLVAVVQRDGWTVRTYRLHAPLRVEAVITVR